MRTIEPVFSEDAKALIRAAIKSVWALELLSYLRTHKDRPWSVKALTRELRASEAVVLEEIASFRAAGLVDIDGDGGVRYGAANHLDSIVEEISAVYVERPITVVKEIYAADRSKIQDLADAFRFKKD